MDAFVAKWSALESKGGKERANLQLFVTDLCSILGVEPPQPSKGDNSSNAYVFERSITETFLDGAKTNRSIDCYKRGCFVLEGKDTGKNAETTGWDKAIRKAHVQASNYVKNLPADESRPPFIIIVDVGVSISLYSEFTRTGGSYVAYPDQQSYKIPVSSLKQPKTIELLRAVWLNPMSLDPSKISARVTRKIAANLGDLAKSLEAKGHAPQEVASFMMRSLFTMFAEDVGLLPERSFTELLVGLRDDLDSAGPLLENLWEVMNKGGYSLSLRKQVLRFNGGMFQDASAIKIDKYELEMLIEAASSDWRHVEPAIFGTLLERALDPTERHKLGAHFTPRSYVERLVVPTVIEPLREEWLDVQAVALSHEQRNKTKDAIATVKAFHHKLTTIKILDPACGSGNFLYVALELMKRLEGEVLEVLEGLKGGQMTSIDADQVAVDPHQFLGIELNPRAARIAEIVLWIGYLQWHFRTTGKTAPPDPVLRDYNNIENRDALITYDAVVERVDENGMSITRWDGKTTKASPITGGPVPDESAQIAQQVYCNPRKAVWPQADYIVGNPPFIGKRNIRAALGDGYVDAIRSTWTEVPESADFVMYWWHIAAEKVCAGQVKRFGFISTNSIKQLFNRRVVQAHLEAKKPLSLVFVIPDHPWVDSADGADVRIAMTTGAAGDSLGRLMLVREEINTDGEEIAVNFQEEYRGKLFAELRGGVNLTSALSLKANLEISNIGVIPLGAGFILNESEAQSLTAGMSPELAAHLIRPYRNGRDLTSGPRGVYAIDTYGYTESQLRIDAPQVWQWLYDRVKPERDQNPRRGRRENWWRYGEDHPRARNAIHGLPRYIVTVMTAKHRTFQFLDASLLPDQKLVVFGLDDALLLGVLSSRVHMTWALASGSNLGVGNDPVYVKTRCFETFPFPDASVQHQTQIRDLAERIDAHRKRQQVQFPELTLTGMYNVLEILRSGDPLSAKDKITHEQGLISVLKALHDELDRAVFTAYGWSDLADKLVGLQGATTPLPDKSEAHAEAEEETLQRLLDLNRKRADEEAKGQIKWLRPEYQTQGHSSHQMAAELGTEVLDIAIAKQNKLSWPSSRLEQVEAIRVAIGSRSLMPDEISSQFKTPSKAKQTIIEILNAWQSLGVVSNEGGSYRLLA